MLVLIVLSWWGIPWIGRWFFGRVTEAGGAQFLFVITLFCGFSYISHYAKMEPIIGAFLAGAAFNRLIPQQSILMNRIVFAGNTLFIPFFLLSVGMLVDPQSLVRDPRSWLVAGVMVGATLVTKQMAAWLAARAFGYQRDQARVMFGLSVVQAAATLAAVLVGYELGIFDKAVLNGAIAMIMVTCPLGSWMVDRHGRRMAARPAPQPTHAPVTEQRVLVPLANPHFAAKLMDLAFLLRDTSKPGSIFPVTIVQESDDDMDSAVTRGEKLLTECMAHITANEIPVTPSVRLDLNTPDGITRAAKELRATLVLSGWRSEYSVKARIFGTVMGNLLDICPSRLFFCRLMRPLSTTKRLVVPFFPFADRRHDLEPFLQDVKFLSGQLGADIRMFLPDPEADALRALTTSIPPARPLSFVTEGTHVRNHARLFGELAEGDLVIFPAHRREDPLWTPAQESLLRQLAARFLDINLIVAYPGMFTPDHAALPIPKSPHGSRQAFQIHPVDIESAETLDAALYAMARSTFSDRPHDAETVLGQLRASLGYPIELASRILLLHAHTDVVETPLMIVGQARFGSWDIPSLRIKTRTLFALLSPKASSGNRHLQTLTDLARCFHQPGVTDAMTAAPDAEAIAGILRTALDRVEGATCPVSRT